MAFVAHEAGPQAIRAQRLLASHCYCAVRRYLGGIMDREQAGLPLTPAHWIPDDGRARRSPLPAAARARCSRGCSDRATARVDAPWRGPHRRALLEGLRGRIVEVGAGNGANFGH